MSVYYLPTRTPEIPEPLAPEWPSLPIRLRNAWWRVRLAVVEVRGLLRGQPRCDMGGVAYEPLFDDEEPLPAPRPARPARIIDFEAARRRLASRPRSSGEETEGNG
jgi:hypothetical protein